MKRACVSFDLSKENTGYCILVVDAGECTTDGVNTDESVRILDFGSFRHPQRNHCNKMYFDPIDFIYWEVRRVINIARVDTSDVSVAFEFPVFSHTSSELQFAIVQSMLRACRDESVDAVGYAAPTLKSFISQCNIGNPVHLMGKTADKGEIKEIYEYNLRPHCPFLPSSAAVSNSDEMDAIFISLMAAILQVPYLPAISIKELKSVFELGDPDHYIGTEIYEMLLMGDPGYYHKISTGKNKNSSTVFFPNMMLSPLTIPEQFKKLFTNAAKNGHMDLTSAMFFPFNKLTGVDYLIRFYQRRPNTVFEMERIISKIIDPSVKKVFEMIRSGACVLSSKKGTLFLSTYMSPEYAKVINSFEF